MTRKDYEKIAREIWLVNLMTDSDKDTLVYLVNGLTTVLLQDNPRFNEDKFREACGL